MIRIKQIIVCLLCASLYFVDPALASEQYLSLSAGSWNPGHTTTIDRNLSNITSTYDTGFALGGTYGVALNNGLRLEAEMVYRQADAKPSDGAWLFAWMCNGWWDARNSSPFTPYLGGGFGFALDHVASPGIVDHTGNGIAYQAGGGVDIRLDKLMSVDLGYRYFGIADTSKRGVGSYDQAGSSIMAGIRWRF